MAVKIYYFTGTGNSRAVAQKIQAELESKERVLCESIGPYLRGAKEIALIDLAEVVQDQRSLIFVYPIHGFTAIWPIYSFLLRFPRALPALQPIDVSVMATTGGYGRTAQSVVPGWEGSGLYLPLLILWLKGYTPRAALPLRYTTLNWTSFFPPSSHLALEELQLRTRRSVAAFVQKFAQRQTQFEGKLSFIGGLLVFPISLVYLLLGRAWLAKLFFTTSRCVGCGFCVRNCPVQALALSQQRPYWRWYCESCMRCLNQCPHQAIEASPLMGLLYFLLIFFPILKIFDLYFGKNYWPFLILSAPIQIALLSLLYHLWWHVMLRSHLIRSLFTSLCWSRFFSRNQKFKL